MWGVAGKTGAFGERERGWDDVWWHHRRFYYIKTRRILYNINTTSSPYRARPYVFMCTIRYSVICCTLWRKHTTESGFPFHPFYISSAPSDYIIYTYNRKGRI
jgi:hypothetical protein